ncbi:MAG: hypothetical protein CSA62_09685 [Planctomycetota bacterium]|nr:MAG: hypothetical protein CSA62_09685 [Planctomycetota bacterium]
MLRLAVAAFGLALVPSCSVCDIEATPGFYRLGSSAAPVWMQSFATGVFKLYTEGETASASQDLSSQRDSKRRSKRHYCTAFLCGDARTLWTNRHGFPYIEAQEDWRFPDLRPGMRLEFQLRNRHGQVVFDTGRAGDYATVDFAGRESWVRMEGGKRPAKLLQASASDFVRILLSRPLAGHVFEGRSQHPEPGEQVYALGWPKETQNRRPSFGEPDSDGKTMCFTAGRVTDELPFQIVDWKQRQELFDAGSFAKWMFLTTADCELGMSGSPIVDAQGKMLGLLSISFTRRNCPGARQASGIRWPEIMRLEEERL